MQLSEKVDHFKNQRNQRKMAPKKQAKAKHIGFGKLILFGEHFTVYKRPALVGALEAYTWAEVSIKSGSNWSCGLLVEDERVAVPGYKDEKRDEMLASVDIVLKHFKVDCKKVGVHIRMGGELCAVSGVGASAASCVAISRALSHELKLNMTDEQINAAAYEGEKGMRSSFFFVCSVGSLMCLACIALLYLFRLSRNPFRY